MSISAMTTLPGKPATLNVDVQTQFKDLKDAYYLDKIWTFDDVGTDPESLIRRVMMIKERAGKISCVDIYFDKKWCSSMTEAFPEKNFQIQFFHHHKKDPELENLCQLQVIGSENIKTLAQLINKTQNFKEDSKAELEQILKLDRFV